MTKSRSKLMLLVLIVFSVANLSAFSLVEVYKNGGPFMHIISLMFVGMIILALTKFWELSIKEKFDAKNFYLKLKGYIKNEQYDAAVKISSLHKTTSMGFIFTNGLLAFNDARKAGKTGQDLQRSLENAFYEASLQTFPKLERGLGWLEIIAQTATLLGLLGTIVGLIQSFESMTATGITEAEKSEMLTMGIATAMGTTAYGLVVAIPTYFVKQALQGRVDKITNNIDEYSVKTINQIVLSTKKG
ncbi:MAG: MotA/TolQ/ExbB proton channel family protein [Candidatus Cloacimonetes bacterium]|nr:MotA/TolQ/ExbB proton channel family protein [Candidatus Cloacimonadota bacterium]